MVGLAATVSTAPWIGPGYVSACRMPRRVVKYPIKIVLPQRREAVACHGPRVAVLTLRAIKASKSNGSTGPLFSPSIRAARKAASLAA